MFHAIPADKVLLHEKQHTGISSRIEFEPEGIDLWKSIISGKFSGLGPNGLLGTNI